MHVQCYQNSDSQIYDVFNSVILIVIVWMIAILLYWRIGIIKNMGSVFIFEIVVPIHP